MTSNKDATMKDLIEIAKSACFNLDSFGSKEARLTKAIMYLAEGCVIKPNGMCLNEELTKSDIEFLSSFLVQMETNLILDPSKLADALIVKSLVETTFWHRDNRQLNEATLLQLEHIGCFIRANGPHEEKALRSFFKTTSGVVSELYSFMHLVDCLFAPPSPLSTRINMCAYVARGVDELRIATKIFQTMLEHKNNRVWIDKLEYECLQAVSWSAQA